MPSRPFLALGVSLFALTGVQAAYAQGTPPAAPQDAAPAAEEEGDEIIVTGTRTQGRSRLESASPVDVLSNQSLQRQGTTELGASLAAVAPSIDFPRPSANDGTDAVRPATLRGLSPDQTLVLINGVRGNSSALLNVNGTVGRGSASFDLNTVPVVALERVEVLRDGASAQYGSDAIAGVVNLRLREARSGGGVSTTYGFYHTDIDTARGSRSVTGEPTVTVSGWQGIALGSEGFLTVSGEYVKREPTNRADFDTRVTPARVTGRYGDPEVEQGSGWVNAAIPVADGWSLYGWGGYQERDSRSAAFPRLATAAAAGGVASLYPNGFVPIINTKSQDIKSALGLRGDLGEWNVDLNLSYGRNRIRFATLDSANYSYGAASPTDFDDGRVTYDQFVVGLDVARKFDLLAGVNVAFGLEGRREGYRIEAGERASYDYPATGVNPGVAPGAQGFGGFAPRNEVDRSRRNVSAYVDVEAQVTDAFLIGVAGRAEDYSDFGSTATGKVSARYEVAPWLALRGAASTGFRAPALQQQYFTSVASVVQNGVPILTGTFPSSDPVARALGGLPLDAEKSTNFSAGTVIRAGGFDLTIDGYHIRVRDQLGLSENLSRTFSPQVAGILDPLNVAAARFFINGLATTSQGIDAVAHYRLRTPAAGVFDLTVAGNVNDIDVTRVPTSTSVLNPAPTLFARSRILSIEDGTPGEKVTGTVDWSLGDLGALARVTYYGNVNQPGTTPAADVFSGRRAITDLELRYEPSHGPRFAIGASNLFDVYPDAITPANNSTGVLGFPYYSPFGFNGRYLYARAGLSW